MEQTKDLILGLCGGLLILFFIYTQHETKPEREPYKGTNKECARIWNLNWDINHELCDEFMNNPKFKKGEYVLHEDYPKHLYKLEIWHPQWAYLGEYKDKPAYYIGLWKKNPNGVYENKGHYDIVLESKLKLDKRPYLQ